jgi:outer membrane cobalamin receptor
VGSRYITPSNTVSIKAYHVHDLTIGTRIRYQDIQTEIQIGVMNVFNHSYQIIERYPTPGRQWNVGLNFEWD